MVRQGLAMLARDEQTETLLLVAKEPEALDALAGAVPDGRRAVAALVGWEGDLDGWEVHPTLEAAALAAAGAAGRVRRRRRRAGAARGASSASSPAARSPTRRASCSNRCSAPSRPSPRRIEGDGHVVVDLGTERYTQGRPHPMVDLGIRLAAARGSGRRRAHGVRPARRRLRPRRARRSRLRAGAARLRARHGAPRWWRACAAPTPTRRTPSRQAADAARRRRGRRAVQRRGSAARREGDRVRIAMLTYSVRPRGGVVHALSVAGALAERGHEVELFAIGPPGTGFFRPPPVPHTSWPTSRPTRPFDERICALIDAYTEGLREPLRDGRLRRRPRAGLHLGQRGAGAARRGRRRRGRPHRPPRRRLPLALADRVPGALDRRPPIASSSSRRRGSRGCATSSASRRSSSPTASTPSASARRATPPSAPPRATRPASPANWPSSPSAASSRARARSPCCAPSPPPARALPERRPVLLVAGGATLFDHRDEIDRFHALREELDLDGSVRVLGPVTDAELESLYRAADLFALPSTKEGFGLAVLEALAAGLPAVVSDLDVFRTYLADGDSALMAPVGDHAALADALVRAAAPRARGAVARRRARRGGAPWLGRGRGGARGGLRALHGGGADGARGRGHVARRLRRPTSRRASTPSASTSPRRPAAATPA